MRTRPANYGIESPFVAVGSLAAAFVLAIAALAVHSAWALIPSAIAVLVGSLVLGGSTLWRPAAEERLLAELGERARGRVVVVRCSRGRSMVLLARRDQIDTVIGLDTWPGGEVSGNAPRSAHYNLTVEHLAERCELLWSDPERLTLADHRADLVWFDPPWRPRPDPVPLDELTRVAAPGATIVVVSRTVTAWPEGCVADGASRRYTLVPPMHVSLARYLGDSAG